MRLLNSTKICNVFRFVFHLFYHNLENVNGSEQVVFNQYKKKGAHSIL